MVFLDRLGRNGYVSFWSKFESPPGHQSPESFSSKGSGVFLCVFNGLRRSETAQKEQKMTLNVNI